MRAGSLESARLSYFVLHKVFLENLAAQTCTKELSAVFLKVGFWGHLAGQGWTRPPRDTSTGTTDDSDFGHRPSKRGAGASMFDGLSC